MDEQKAQQQYYADTADQYDAMHLDEQDEHYFALTFLLAAVDWCGAKSILDVGAGTGRAIQHFQRLKPDVRVVGVEPVRELREIGYRKGIPEENLVSGDANKLRYGPGDFDIVCEFGVLHHVPKPAQVVAEMLRVANKGIFISDSNNFGQGSLLSRNIKQLLNLVGLWKFADYIKTKGKGYTVSEGDGIAYSYSVFNQFRQIKNSCSSIHLLNTSNGSGNLYRTASHVGLFGIKDRG